MKNDINSNRLLIESVFNNIAEQRKMNDEKRVDELVEVFMKMPTDDFRIVIAATQVCLKKFSALS